MICEGNFVFKGIRKRDGGTFKNDKGVDVPYDAAYVVKFDEFVNDEPTERTTKFDANNVELYNKFSKCKVYDKVQLKFDVGFTKTGVAMKLVDFSPLVMGSSK